MTKYQPLYEYLVSRQHLPRVRMTFAEVSHVIRAPLPKSAFTYREWWANQTDTAGRPQAAAWQGAGFEVASLHQESASGHVEFVRRR